MKIGILQTAYKKSDDYGAFYNVQELGLARALAENGHGVILYKAVDGESKVLMECQDRLTIKLLGVKYLGINGLVNVNDLDKSIDVLVYFCDTQLKVPSVYNWCRKNNVKFIPYIGVVESHSENPVKRMLMDRLTARNIAVFKKCRVLVKTPVMYKKLEEIGCKDVNLFHVGLDETVMHRKSDSDVEGARDEDTSKEESAVRLLFIGRMEEEKQPLGMVRLYEKVLEVNQMTELVMIGTGHMYGDVEASLNDVITRYGLADNQARLFRKVPYSEMYKYYEWASLYVNLNQVEILGMSILEAMYYKCPILAITAPGPEFILRIHMTDGEDDYCGMVAPDMESLGEVLKMVVNGQIDSTEIDRLTKTAENRVKMDFVWGSLADKLIEIIER